MSGKQLSCSSTRACYLWLAAFDARLGLVRLAAFRARLRLPPVWPAAFRAARRFPREDVLRAVLSLRCLTAARMLSTRFG
jgi:hypothetical protein